MPTAAFDLLSGRRPRRRPLSARHGTGAPVSDDLKTVAIGKGIIRRQGEKTAFIAFGSMVAPALAVAEKLNATVADMRFVKPIDEELIVHLAQSHDYIVPPKKTPNKAAQAARCWKCWRNTASANPFCFWALPIP